MTEMADQAADQVIDGLSPAIVVVSRQSFYQLALPEALTDIQGETDSRVMAWIGAYIAAEKLESDRSIEAASSRANALIERLDALNAFVKSSSTDRMDLAGPADEPEHDRYFQIQRVLGPAQPLVVRSILDAKTRYYDAVKLSYEPSDRQLYSGIALGFDAALAHLAGEIPARMTMPDRPAPGRSTEAPARRWVLGHQIFAAMTQCIIIAMISFEAAMAADDRPAAGSALDLAATLLLASASAFRFTADFPPVAYQQTVRPSMAPEHVGRGFSGLLSGDHRVLVEVMVRTRPLMATAAAVLPEQHGRVSAALSYVYDDHKFVCARFGGGEGSSLRSDACSEVPGVVLLDRFKRARTRLLRPMGKLR